MTVRQNELLAGTQVMRVSRVVSDISIIGLAYNHRCWGVGSCGPRAIAITITCISQELDAGAAPRCAGHRSQTGPRARRPYRLDK
jgi:hypothetical protein